MLLFLSVRCTIQYHNGNYNLIESHIILEQWCWCEIISNIIIWSVESELLNNYECWIRWNEIHYNGFIFLFKVMDNWHRTLSYNENDFSLSKWLECWYSVQCFVLLVLLHFTRKTGIVVSHSIEFTISIRNKLYKKWLDTSNQVTLFSWYLLILAFEICLQFRDGCCIQFVLTSQIRDFGLNYTCISVNNHFLNRRIHFHSFLWRIYRSRTWLRFEKSWWWRCWHFLHILLRRFLWDLKLDTWLWLLTLNAMSTWIRNKGLCRNIACRNVYDLTMSWDTREDWWDLRCYRLKNALRMVHC